MALLRTGLGAESVSLPPVYPSTLFPNNGETAGQVCKGAREFGGQVPHGNTELCVERGLYSVHTFISFPISDVLTGKRILVGNRSQEKLLGKQVTKYIRSQYFPEVGWFPESEDVSLSAVGALEGLAGPWPVPPNTIHDGAWKE